MCEQNLKARLIALLTQKIGYPIDSAKFICEQLIQIANLYHNAQAAFEIIVQTMEAKIIGPFSSQQFTAFIREINPNHTPRYVYEQILGIGPDEIDILEPDEQTEYWQEKNQLDRELNWQRQNNLDYLRNSQAWDILTSHHWRQLQPSLGVYKEIKGGAISTPLGGQPGFKRKTRHP